jgi:hypothetical protein
MFLLADNRIRPATRAMSRTPEDRRRLPRRSLLAWLFCLTLVFAALPVLPATCAKPANCGIAAHRPCCGCCAPRSGGGMHCALTARGSSLHGAACEAAAPVTPVASASALQGRGLQLSPDADDACAVIGGSALAATPPDLLSSSSRAVSNGPPGHAPLLHPGRAPPASC